MHDLCAWLGPLALIYGAAAVGLVPATALRVWSGRRGRQPSSLEARCSAGLPVLSVLLLPAASIVAPQFCYPASPLHQAWHNWEASLQSSPATHATLHLLDLLLVLWCLSGVIRCLRLMARMWRFSTRLRKLGQPVPGNPGGPSVFRIPASRPLCLTIGAWKPAIFLTAGLDEQLGPEDRAAVLAHETAHARRRDPLISAFLHSFYALIPLPGSRSLLQDCDRAAERACDLEASRQVGSPHKVARALVRVARILGPSSGAPGTASFASGENDVEGRVRALLAGSKPFRPGLSLLLLLVGSALTIAFADGALPHVVELLVHH